MWQTIDSAPKDGTEFLAYLSDEPGYSWMQVISFDGRNYEDVRGHLIPDFASHWQPLPDAPEHDAMEKVK